jgi:hypothetical protein
MDQQLESSKDDIIIIISYATLEFEEPKHLPWIIFPNEKRQFVDVIRINKTYTVNITKTIVTIAIVFFIVILSQKIPNGQSKTTFLSQEPNTQNGKGQCNSCKEWNTIAEEIIQNKKSGMEKRINDK